jgi:PAS domain S-box-containing protein
LVHPDDRRAMLEWLNAAEAGLGPGPLEFRAVRPDGSIRVISAQGEKVPGQGHEPPRMVGTVQDITERKQAEDALRVSEERLRLALQASGMGTFELNLVNGNVHWNPIEFELLGLKPGEAPACAATFFRCLHPDDVQAFRAQWDKAMQTGDFDAEFRVAHADGTERWLARKGRLIFQGSPSGAAARAKGPPTRFLGVNFDITVRKREEQRRHLLHETSRVLATAESLAQAVPKLLQLIAGAFNWDVGEFWEVDARRENLRVVHVWHAPGKKLAAFVKHSLKLAMPLFDGLPGRVLAMRKPHWIPDLSRCPHFIRKPEAAKVGLRSALGFPITLDGHALGVMAFLGRAMTVPDEDLLQLFASLGMQIGQFMERKQAEEKLRESEQRYRELIHGLPVAVYTCDAKGRILLYNAAAVALWGREPERGLDRWSAVHRAYTPDGRRLQKSRVAMALAIRTGEPIRGMEQINERPDGSRAHVLAFANPICDASGDVTGGVNILVDVTALKVAENALRTSERKLRTFSHVIEQGPASVLITDPSGRIEYVNPKFTEVTGYSVAEVLGKNPRLLDSRQQPREHYKELWKTIRAGRDWRGEFCNRKKNGDLFWEFAVIAPIRDERGTITHIVAIQEDITARRRAAEALRRQAGLLELSQEAIFVWRLGGAIDFWNNGAAELYGYTVAEAVGSSSHELLQTRFPMPLPQIEAALRTHGTWAGELRQITKAGQEVIVSSRLQLVPGEAGAPMVLESNRDITERKRLEAEVLRISEAEHLRIGRDLHDDLGQQLAGVWMFASTLEKNLRALSSPEADSATRIAAALDKALALTRSLARGLQPVMPESRGLTAALLELAERNSELFNLRCRLDSRDPVPVHDPAVATHLFRIAQEAVTNAARHGHAKHISIKLSSSAKNLVLSVNDDGAGMHEVSRNHDGTGIRTMNYRAGAMGGSVVIRKRPRGGTSVVCTIPRPPDPAPKKH